MTRAQYVSGGVGPPKVEVLSGSGDLLRTLVFPEAARFNESYEIIGVRCTAITGDIVDVPRGYRYRVDMEFRALTLDAWKDIVRMFTDYGAGRRLRFYPHEDDGGIYYEVIPAAGMALPYLQGRYLGYEGKVSFIGVEVLDYIPCAAKFSYFCLTDEGDYSPDEITYYTDAEESNYAAGEISYFSGAATIGHYQIN